MPSLTVAKIAKRTGISERTLYYAAKVHEQGIPALVLAVEAGTLSCARAATIADLPHDQQQQALTAALRGEKPPKRPTAAERAAADVQVWQTRCRLLALEIEHWTGEDAASVVDRVIARLRREQSQGRLSARSSTFKSCAI